MITQNELYDLSFVISLIRSEIDNPNNVIVLKNILLLLENTKELTGNNQIRKQLSQISQLNEKWEFIRHENYYVRTLIFKNEKVHNELLKNLTDLYFLLKSKKFQQAYDLSDALHMLPEVIADNKGRIPNSYYKAFKNSYKKKWKIKEK